MKIIEIEQGTDRWHVYRFRSIGGTRLHSAIGAKFSVKSGWSLGDKKIQNTLLNEMISEYQSELEIDDYCSAAMQRGHDLEPESVAAASKELGVELETFGMFQSDIHECFIYSPDAGYREGGLVVGGYETKSKTGAKHVEYIRAGVVPPEHLIQCLAPMIMDDCVQWWSFGSYDDRNHVNPLFLVKITREEYADFINEARAQLAMFIKLVESEVEKLGGAYHGKRI